MTHQHSDAVLLRAFLDTTEHAICPLTRKGVEAGAKARRVLHLSVLELVADQGVMRRCLARREFNQHASFEDIS